MKIIAKKRCTLNGSSKSVSLHELVGPSLRSKSHPAEFRSLAVELAIALLSDSLDGWAVRKSPTPTNGWNSHNVICWEIDPSYNIWAQCVRASVSWTKTIWYLLRFDPWVGPNLWGLWFHYTQWMVNRLFHLDQSNPIWFGSVRFSPARLDTIMFRLLWRLIEWALSSFSIRGCYYKIMMI